MAGVKRRVFNVLAAISLVLCLFAASLLLLSVYRNYAFRARLMARYGTNVHVHESYTYVQVAGVPLSLWSVVLTASLLPAWWLILLLMDKRAKQSLTPRCKTCGYDLRAT